MIAFAIILIIPTVAIGWTSYQTAKSKIHDELLINTTRNIGFLDNQITELITLKILDMNYLSSTINAGMIDGFESVTIREKLDQFIALHPDYENVYFGTNEGLMIRSPEPEVRDESYDPRERPWYISAMEKKGDVVLNDPMVAAATGNVVVIPSKATDDGSGVVGGNLDLSALAHKASLVEIGKEGYVFILDQDQRYIAHPTTPAGEKNTSAHVHKFYESKSGDFIYNFNGEEKEAVFTTNELTGWKIIGTIELSEIDQATSGILYTTLIVIVLSIIAGAAVVFVIVRTITRAFKVVTDATESIAQGDLTEEIPVTSKDELGQLSMAMNAMIGRLRELINEIISSTHNVASASEQLSASTEEIASGSSDQANAAQTVNELVRELSAAIDTVAQNAEDASQLSNQTVSIAQESGLVVEQSIHGMTVINEQMTRLEEDSNRIGEIIEVIDDIAEQTNLLALNAAIEAARAGEQGRGFAVVADEVRKLAERSGKATKQITDIIKGMQNNTGMSVKSVSEAVEKTALIQEAFEKIAGMINESSTKAAEIAAASEEQSAQSREVLQSVETISAASEEAAAATEEMAATTQSLSKLAEDLEQSVSVFRVS